MQHFRPFSASLLLLFLWQSALAQTIPPKLEADWNKTINQQRLSIGVRSLSAAIQMPDNAIWTKADGVSSTTPLDYVTPDHVYCIGSVTKTITAACILQLADEGKLKIDDSVGRWLPPYPFVNGKITIRQLLNHTSGLYDVITNPDYDKATKAKLDSVWTLHNLVRDYIKAPLFEPGASWSYSNTNYALLGLIVEKVTGRSYHTEYLERFFKPLKMTSMALRPKDPLPAKVAHFWTQVAPGVSGDAHNFFSKWISFFSSAGPIGGYFGTPKDLTVWTKALMKGAFLSQNILNEAKKVVSMNANGNYGLGIMERRFLNLKAYGHGGDIGYSATSYYFPDKDISITVFNNEQKSNATSWGLDQVVIALLKNYLDYQATLDADDATAQACAISIAPNPFTDAFSISMHLPEHATSAQVMLHDNTGRLLENIGLGALPAGEQTLPVQSTANLPSGLYAVQVVLDGKLATTRKVLKQ